MAHFSKKESRCQFRVKLVSCVALGGGAIVSRFSSVSGAVLRDPESGWALDFELEWSRLESIAAQGCNLRHVEVSDLSAEGLQDIREPVIIRNGSSRGDGCGAQCTTAWQRERFIELFGDLPVSLANQAGTALFGPPVSSYDLAGYPRKLATVVEALEGSMNNSFAFDANTDLLQSVIAATPGWGHAGAWPSLFSQLDQLQVLSLGPSRAGLPFHDHGTAFLWLVHGRKRWYLFPPGDLPDELMVWSQGRTTWEWLEEALFAEGSSAFKDPSRNPGIWQCTQEPGEVVIVPHRWHHATVNVGMAVGFGGQASPRMSRTIDADIAAHPKALGFYMDKLSHGSNVRVGLQTMLEARKQLPDSLLVCSKLLSLLTQGNNIQGMLLETRTCRDIVKRLEKQGVLSSNQSAVVLAQLGSQMMEDGALDMNDAELKKNAPWISLLKESLKRNKENDYALFNLALAQERRGQLEESRKLLQLCLKLKPGHERAKQGLEYVRKRLKEKQRTSGREL